jgi:BirA family biotin operon repressor/biotin-[acetyl-CoA-carboxylase] ligase
VSETFDLSREAIESVLPGRAFRTFRALLSTEAEAMRWARQGAPDGAVVTAGYQASPRGRSGLSFDELNDPDHGLGFSLVVRRNLPATAEGWLYPVGVLGAFDAIGDDGLTVEWPDRLLRDDMTRAAAGVQAEVVGETLRWAVVTLFVPAVQAPRAGLLAAMVEATEARLAQPADMLRADYHDVCGTFGRHVQARLLPLGPAAPTHVGIAVDLALDGGLVIEEASGAHVVIDPQSLGFLEDGPPQADNVPVH